MCSRDASDDRPARERPAPEVRNARFAPDESERKYRELVETANSIILRMDPEGRVTFLNNFGQRFFGFTEEAVSYTHLRAHET